MTNRTNSMDGEQHYLNNVINLGIVQTMVDSYKLYKFTCTFVNFVRLSN